MKKATLIKGEFQYMTVPQYNKLIIQLAKAKRKKEKEKFSNPFILVFIGAWVNPTTPHFCLCVDKSVNNCTLIHKMPKIQRKK